MAITETLLGGLLRSLGDLANDLRREATNRNVAVTVGYSDARRALIEHVARVESWSSSISMLNLRRAKKLEEAFVELNLDIGFSRYARPSDSASDSAKESTISVSELVRMTGHFAILGRPGAGKTTSLQRLAQLTLIEWYAGTGGAPIMLSLRDLRNGDGIVEHLLTELGLAVRTTANDPTHRKRTWEEQALYRYLSLVNGILLVDGLDEVDPVSRRQVEDDLRDLARYPGNHRLFLTCRTAEYGVNLQHVQPLTVLPLSDDKVQAFAHQWLGSARGDAFLALVTNNPYAGTEVVPLTLAHLCAVYERDGSLPPRPVDVYEAIVSMLVEQWDRERGVMRVSRYAEFVPRKKERFLQALAFELAVDGRKGSFHHEDLRRAYLRIHKMFDLPLEEEGAVTDEVESHTGLIVQVGFRQYQFMHLVIQEFLTAMHVQRTPDGIRHLVPHFPNEMALIAAYSTNVEEYLEEVLKRVLPTALNKDEVLRFLAAFVARLSIEKVKFPPTTRTGWILLCYLDMIGARRSSIREEFPASLTGALEFFLTTHARTAIELALDQAIVVEKHTNGIRLRTRPSNEAPEFIRRAVRVQGLLITHEGDLSRALPSRFNSGEALLADGSSQ